ncbi:tape measure protein [Alistipes indistinctus]|uniref:tape measure protein n=1 Tax=Alistipes indistinctus TaxID=626932 RepID=UPI00267548E3|nr:tape measure protein [Alistipes indistinctus]
MIDYGVKINVGGNAATVMGQLFTISQKLDTIMQKLNSMSSKLGDTFRRTGTSAQQATQKAESGFKRVSTAIGDARQRLDRLNFGFRGLGSRLAGLGLSIGAVDIGRRIINAGGNEEDILARLQFALKDRDKAIAMNNELKAFGRRAPIPIQDMRQQAAMLAPVFKDQTMKYFKMLGDVVSGSGGDFSNIAYNFAQIKSMGRTYGIDLRQFAMQNIPIWQELAKVLNVPVEKMEEISTSGKITFDVVAKAFENMTKEGGIYFGAMEARAHTFRGQWQIIGNKMQEIWVKFFEKARPYLQQFSDWVEKQIENFDELIPKIKAVGYTLAGVFAFKTLVGFINGLQTIVKLLNIISTSSVLGGKLGGVVGRLGLAGGAIAGVYSLYETAKSQSDHNFIRKYTDYDFTSAVKNDPDYINKQLSDENFGRAYLSSMISKLTEYNKKITEDLTKFSYKGRHWNLLTKTLDANSALRSQIVGVLGGGNINSYSSNAISQIAGVNTDLSPRGVSGNGGIKNFQITFNSPVVQIDDKHVEGEKYTPEQLGQTAAKEFVNILTQIAVQ